MSTLGILAGVGAAVSVSSIGCYAIWHNGINVWLLNDLGRLVSYVLFPGESDLFDVALQHRPGNALDITNHAPCILCSKARIVTIQPDNSTWTTPSGATCNESIRGLANSTKYWSMPYEFHDPATDQRVTYYQTNECEKYRPPDPEKDGTPQYNVNLSKDCYTVKGVGGMPPSIGMKPSDYLRRRLFPDAASMSVIKDSQINTKLFTDGSPYLRYHALPHIGVYTGLVGPNFRGFYKPVPDSISMHGLYPFMPPLINCRTWVAWNSTAKVKEYICLEQLDANQIFVSNTATNAHTLGLLVRPEPADFRETFAKYIKSINLQACQVFTYNGNTYYTFEYTPHFKNLGSYTGDTHHPVLIPVNQWDEKACGQYVETFMSSKSYQFTPSKQPVNMKRRVRSDRFRKV